MPIYDIVELLDIWCVEILDTDLIYEMYMKCFVPYADHFIFL